MSLLFFWKGENYYDDIAVGKAYHLNQNNKLMHNLFMGEHVWAFTRRKDKDYVLAADLVVVAAKFNLPGNSGYEYGKYHVDGDRLTTRYFDVDKGSDVEPIIRSLSFAPKAKVLGQSFRGNNGVRLLTQADELILSRFSVWLPTI